MQSKRENGRRTKEEGGAMENADKVMEDSQTSNGFDRRTGTWNRFVERDSEYQLAPKCPSSGNPSFDSVPRPPYSSISVESPVSMQSGEAVASSPSPPLWTWGARSCVWVRTAVALYTGAAAHNARFRRSGDRNSDPGGRGFPRSSTHPACVRL